MYNRIPQSTTRLTLTCTPTYPCCPYSQSHPWELFRLPIRTKNHEDAMKAYFNNLPMRLWLLMVLPLVVAAYPVARIVIPAVVHAVVPEVVRSVLTLI